VSFEVELKHRVDDEAALVARLAECGAVLSPPITQSDQYFAHPSRDFAQTDEALRIRVVGDQAFVTYKGPKLDTATKTRRELELPLDPSDAGGRKFAELLAAIGFTPVAVVTKQRSTRSRASARLWNSSYWPTKRAWPQPKSQLPRWPANSSWAPASAAAILKCC
jgi:adenylate cyclase class 2